MRVPDLEIERMTHVRARDELIFAVRGQVWGHVSVMPTVDDCHIVAQLGRRTVAQVTAVSPKVYGFDAEQTLVVPNHGYYEDGAWQVGKLMQYLGKQWRVYLA